MDSKLHSTYKGCNIYRIRHNGMYTAMIEHRDFPYGLGEVKADTLAGIKQMISKYRKGH